MRDGELGSLTDFIIVFKPQQCISFREHYTCVHESGELINSLRTASQHSRKNGAGYNEKHERALESIRILYYSSWFAVVAETGSH